MKMPSFFLESLRPNRGEVGWAAVSLSACICVLEVCLNTASTSWLWVGGYVFLGLGLGQVRTGEKRKAGVLPPHGGGKGQQAEFQGLSGTRRKRYLLVAGLGGRPCGRSVCVCFEKKENQRREYGLETRRRRSPALPALQQQAWALGCTFSAFGLQS
jgi:hypothetical protein